MTLVNLTNRWINLYDETGEERVGNLPPDGRVVAVSINAEVDNHLDVDGYPVPVVGYVYEDVSGLPDPVEGTTYVVSYAVLQALDDSRPDMVAPDTSPTSVVRHPDTGRVLGVRRFRVL